MRISSPAWTGAPTRPAKARSSAIIASIISSPPAPTGARRSAISGDNLLEGPSARRGGGEPAAGFARQQAPVQQADGDRLQRGVDTAAGQSPNLPAELRQQPQLVRRERNAAPFGNAAIGLPAM